MQSDLQFWDTGELMEAWLRILPEVKAGDPIKGPPLQNKRMIQLWCHEDLEEAFRLQSKSLTLPNRTLFKSERFSFLSENSTFT